MSLFKRHGKDVAAGDQPAAGQPVAPVAPVAQQRGATVNVKDLMAYARTMQEQAQSQMHAVQQAQSSGGGVGALMAALGMRYSSDFVKRVDCPSCGAPKKLPSASAYLYCDYCGALADYDFRRACEDSASAMPGPEYVQLVNSSGAESRQALMTGDRDRYRAIQQRIFDAYVTHCPKALSHRIGDPDYRTKVVAYMAESSVVNDFDADYASLMDEMRAKVAGMEWTGSMMDRRTGGPTFRALVDVVMRQAACANALAAAAGLWDLDPDHTSPAVRERMHHSLFSQGWLPFLGEEDAAWLIAELKLGGEYTKVEELAEGETRHCGICGGDVTALPGAKAVVCNHCGHSLDVGSAQLSCKGCGGSITMPVGTPRVQCPYCKAEVERVGWT